MNWDHWCWKLSMSNVCLLLLFCCCPFWLSGLWLFFLDFSWLGLISLGWSFPSSDFYSVLSVNRYFLILHKKNRFHCKGDLFYFVMKTIPFHELFMIKSCSEQAHGDTWKYFVYVGGRLVSQQLFQWDHADALKLGDE